MTIKITGNSKTWSKEVRLAMLNILEDVEEARKKAEEERDKTQSVVNSLADGLLVFDQQNNLSLINPRAEIFFDLKSRDIVSRSIAELSTFPTLDPLMKLVGQEIREVFRKELKLGEKLTLEVSTVLMAEGEEKRGSLIILHDVTREKIIEGMKTEFVSLAAHQLRTPLSAIKWALRMLFEEDTGKITEGQRDLIEKAYKSNERMIGLINDLLDITRIEEGRYLSESVLTDPAAIVQFAINSYQQEIQHKQIKFDFKKSIKKFPRVKVDVEKIRLAVQNLLDNAIRYTPNGGAVTIYLGLRENKIEFKIQDTGVGIPKDQQERVFTKFFRADNAVKKETEGSGLGLFITKNIIEAHGGTIWFESKESRGTTFYFNLPAEE